MTQKANWTVTFSNQVRKQQKKLPEAVCNALTALVYDLQENGPEAVEWRNYGKLSGKKNYFHCHLNKNHPRYVAVWKVETETIRLIEVRYVGTHESVNYNRID